MMMMMMMMMMTLHQASTSRRWKVRQSWQRVSGSSVKWVNKFGWVTWVTGSAPVTRWPILHCTHPISHVIFWFTENQQRQSKLLFWLSVHTFSQSL